MNVQLLSSDVQFLKNVYLQQSIGPRDRMRPNQK